MKDRIKSSGGVLSQMNEAGDPTSLSTANIREAFEQLMLTSPSENRESIMAAEYLLGISDEQFISIYTSPPKNTRFIGGSKTLKAIEKRAEELGI